MRTLLQRRIIGQTTTRQLQTLLATHLPVLEKPISATRWQQRAKRVRQQMLKLFFRGHADGLLDDMEATVEHSRPGTNGGPW